MYWSSQKEYNCSNSVKMTIALLRVLIRTGFSPNWRLRMHHPNLPLSGTCRCATIRFKLLATPIMVVACHCRDCQTLTSNAFSITAMVPTHGFKIIEGEPVERSLPKSHRHHFFCLSCMTWLFTKIEGIETRINVRPTLCDDSSWVKPFIETMTRDKLPWATTSAVHSFDEFPTPDEFQSLQAQFLSEEQ